jgi:hypothetical protein
VDFFAGSQHFYPDSAQEDAGGPVRAVHSRSAHDDVLDMRFALDDEGEKKHCAGPLHELGEHTTA